MPVGLNVLMRELRERAGRSVQSIGYASGAMGVLARIGGRRGAIILMYHSVADDPERNFIDPRNHVAPAVFEEQMKFLAGERTVLSLERLVEMIREGENISGDAIAITFDDGYRDNLTIAAPILERYELPATIFLPTKYIDDAEPQWVDRLFTMFRHRSNDRLVVRDVISNGEAIEQSFDLADPAQEGVAYRLLCTKLLSASYEARGVCLQAVAEQLMPTSTCPQLTMSWTDVETLHRDYPLFSIGGHTVEHADLTNATADEVWQELSASRDRIDEQCGSARRAFSFPYGRCSKQLQRAVESKGYFASCGGGFGPVVNAASDPFALPRVEAPAEIERFAMLTESANSGFWRRLGR